MEFLEFVEGKKILHLTHIFPDCDGVASVYWGLKVFGGDYYFHKTTSRKSLALMEYLGFEPFKRIPDVEDFDLIMIYDSEKCENVNYIDLKRKPFVVFDHHPRESELERLAIFSWKFPNSANVVNLYEFSKKYLSKEIFDDPNLSFAFAVALYTDTIALKTARENELKLMGEFLGDRRLEDILNLFSKKPIDSREFIRSLSEYEERKINGYKIGILKLKDSEDMVHTFIDGLFYPFGLDLLIIDTQEGLKFHVRKKDVQKIYHMVLIRIAKSWGIERQRGIWRGFHDIERLLGELGKYLE